MNISLPKLNLPDFELLFRHDAGQNLIYDKFRKKYVVLTPEEWVRQNFLMYLVRDKKFPEG